MPSACWACPVVPPVPPGWTNSTRPGLRNRETCGLSMALFGTLLTYYAGHKFSGVAFGTGKLVARIVSEKGAEERHGEADAADHGVFPCGLQRRHLAVESDQEDGGEGGEFNGRPHDAEVIRQCHQQHGKHEQRRQAVIHAEFGFRTVTPHLAIEGT